MGNGKKDYKVTVLGNRRVDTRTPLLVLKVNDPDGNTFFGYAKNISKSGLFITTINPREKGEEFDITFELQDAKITVTCRCQVVWTRAFDPELKIKPGMGIKFVNLDEETTAKLEKWVLDSNKS